MRFAGERCLSDSRHPHAITVVGFLLAGVFLIVSGCAIAPAPMPTGVASRPQAEPSEVGLAIREPADGSTLPSPVHLQVDITGRLTNTRVEVLVDSIVIAQLPDNEHELQLPLRPGTHVLAIRATDSTGRSEERSISVRVPAARFAYAASLQTDGTTISQFVVDPETGELVPNGTAANPMFGALAVSPDSNYLYAGSRPPASFSINQQSGALTPVSPKGNFGNAGAVTVDPQQKFVFNSWPDLTSVLGYDIDPQNGMPIEPGSWVFVSICCGGSPFGPTRDGILALSKDGRRAYWGHGNIDVLSVDRTSGAMTRLQELTMQELGGAPSHMMLTPNERFLYAGSDFTGQLWGFSVDPDSGQLSKMPGTPLGLPRGGTYSTLAVSDAFVFASSSAGPDVFSFAIDPHTGHLTPAFTVISAAQPFARWLRIDPSGHFLYASTDSGIEVFEVEQQHGELNHVSTVITPGAPHRVVFAKEE